MRFRSLGIGDGLFQGCFILIEGQVRVGRILDEQDLARRDDIAEVDGDIGDFTGVFRGNVDLGDGNGLAGQGNLALHILAGHGIRRDRHVLGRAFYFWDGTGMAIEISGYTSQEKDEAKGDGLGPRAFWEMEIWLIHGQDSYRCVVSIIMSHSLNSNDF